MDENFTPMGDFKKFQKLVVQSAGIKFYGLFSIAQSRAEGLLSNAPEMISFIEDYVKDKEIYYDIGANIGVFSMYSAIKKNAKVFAFEPESSNYFMLNKNISLNKLSGKVIAFNIAINDI